MAEKFIDWLSDIMDVIWEAVTFAVKSAFALLIVIVFFPAWIIPFLYWYFAVWKKGEEENE